MAAGVAKCGQLVHGPGVPGEADVLVDLRSGRPSWDICHVEEGKIDVSSPQCVILLGVCGRRLTVQRWNCSKGFLFHRMFLLRRILAPRVIIIIKICRTFLFFPYP
jgi:hypothetical protein